MFKFLAKLFGMSSKPEVDPATLSKFRQLRERSEADEPADGKRKDLLLRMRGYELQSASIIRYPTAAGAGDTGSAGNAGRSESGKRDISGRKGF